MALVISIHFFGESVKAFRPASLLNPSNSRGNRKYKTDGACAPSVFTSLFFHDSLLDPEGGDVGEFGFDGRGIVEATGELLHHILRMSGTMVRDTKEVEEAVAFEAGLGSHLVKDTVFHPLYELVLIVGLWKDVVSLLNGDSEATATHRSAVVTVECRVGEIGPDFLVGKFLRSHLCLVVEHFTAKTVLQHRKRKRRFACSVYGFGIPEIDVRNTVEGYRTA